MIIILRPDVDPNGPEIKQVLRQAEQYPGVEARVHEVRGETRSLVEVYLIGRTASVPKEVFEEMPGVERVVRVSQKYRIIGRHEGQVDAVGFTYNGVPFDQGTCHVFAGLCAVDTKEHVEKMMQACQRAGLVTTRMGAYKPRTSPYDFQGLGKECLPYVFELAGKYGIRVIAMEITHEDHIDEIRSALRAAGGPHGRDAPDRDPKRPELRAPEGRGSAEGIPGSLQARHGDYPGGIAQRVRVRGERGKSEHRLLPSGRQDPPGRSAPQPGRFRPRAGRQASHADAGLHRSVPLRRAARSGAGRHSGHLSRHGPGLIAGANMVLVDFHPAPAKALCDGPQALLLEELGTFLEDAAIVRQAYERRKALALAQVGK